MIDFVLSDEQELLRSTARTLLAKECPTTLVRASIDDPSAALTLWKQLCDFVELADGPLVDHCLFLEETGAVCAPGPFFVTSAVGVPLLQAAAISWDGTSALSVVWPGAVEWPYALDADTADAVAVVVPGDQPTVAIVDAVPLEPVDWVDLTRRAFTAAPPADSSGSPADTVAVLRRATIAAAAEMTGTTRWLVGASVEYAKERVQFGRPIGSFQAVQHMLADMALELERATSAVYYAAMAFDALGPHDDEVVRATHVAKAAAGEAATRAAKDGIQVHGGIGYTWEHDLHLFLRRAYAMEHLLGSTSWHHDRLASAMFDRYGRNPPVTIEHSPPRPRG